MHIPQSHTLDGLLTLSALKHFFWIEGESQTSGNLHDAPVYEQGISLRDGRVIPLSVSKEGFEVDTSFLEQEMIAYNGGIDLADFDFERVAEDEKYAPFVPHFSKGVTPNREEVLDIAHIFPEINTPCSMSLDSVEELAEHVAVGYRTSHFHYILGKKHDVGGTFPYWCCGVSSRSVMLSLIELGYPNAAYVHSTAQGHGYTLLPFVFEKEGIQGSVLIDPTSDQLWIDADKRNAIHLKLGSQWEYGADWDDGKNMFPDIVCSLSTLRITPSNICNASQYHVGGEEYLKRAFSNPVKIREGSNKE